MKRLITNLFSRFKKKPQEQAAEAPTGFSKQGAFMNQEEDEISIYYDHVHDEETGVHFSIQYACLCGLLVYALKSDEYGFACEHCDSVCHNKEPEDSCKWCENLFTAEEVS